MPQAAILNPSLKKKPRLWLSAPLVLGILAVIVVFILSDRASNQHTLESPLTVELSNAEQRVLLKAPLGTFWISPAADFDADSLLLKSDSVFMQWHIPSDTPRYLWQQQQAPGVPAGSVEYKQRVGDPVFLNVDVSITSPNFDHAADARSYYLDRLLNHQTPELRLHKEQSMWNGTATRYANRLDNGIYTIVYTLQQHSPNDASILYCTNGASYCSLYGARLNKELYFRQINVPVNDIQHWRRYQDKARSLVQKCIVSQSA